MHRGIQIADTDKSSTSSASLIEELLDDIARNCSGVFDYSEEFQLNEIRIPMNMYDFWLTHNLKPSPLLIFLERKLVSVTQCVYQHNSCLYAMLLVDTASKDCLRSK